jgi:hypothetical protein
MHVSKRKKNKDNQAPIAAPEITSAGPIEIEPVLEAIEEALEWAHDVAAGLVRDYPEEVASIERARAFMRKRFRGEPATVAVEDVLFAIGLVISSIDRDPGPIAVRILRLAEPLWFPSAAQLWERSLPRPVIRAPRFGGAFTTHHAFA